MNSNIFVMLIIFDAMVNVAPLQCVEVRVQTAEVISGRKIKCDNQVCVSR